MLARDRVPAQDEAAHQQGRAGDQRHSEMDERCFVKAGDEIGRVIQDLMRDYFYQFVVQKDDDGESQQHERRQVKQGGAPAAIFEQVVTNRIDGAEMQEQWRE